MFEPGWTAEEQLLMFEGLKRFGFGSWGQVAEFMATKGQEEIERHYLALFLQEGGQIPLKLQQGGEVPLKQQQGLQIPLKQQQGIQMALQLQKGSQIPNKLQKGGQIPIKLQMAQRGQYLQQAKTESRQRKKQQRQSKAKPAQSIGNASELVGYMPLRQDFQIQFDNDAELLLAQLDFLEQDTPQERKLKLSLFQVYNHRIDERLKRKKVVLEHGLLDFRRQADLQRRLARQERDLIALMRPFAQFSTGEDHAKLLEALLKERRLAYFVDCLKGFQAAGYKTFAEVEAYVYEQTILARKKKKAKGWHLTNQQKALRARAEPTRVQPLAQLTVPQFRFCEQTQLPVSQFMSIRESLQKEQLEHGSVRRQSLDSLGRVDRRKLQAVFQMLKRSRRIVERGEW